MQEGFRLCGYLSGRLSGGQVGGSVYPMQGRSGADAPQGPRGRVGSGEGREKNSETLMLGRLPPIVKAGLSAH